MRLYCAERWFRSAGSGSGDKQTRAPDFEVHVWPDSCSGGSDSGAPDFEARQVHVRVVQKLKSSCFRGPFVPRFISEPPNNEAKRL